MVRECLPVKSPLPLAVKLQGQTAILEGEVATDHDRRVAEQLVRLEPGVWEVRNLLIVAAPPTRSPATASPAALPTRLPAGSSRPASDGWPLLIPPQFPARSR
jgi:hypothetical protein